jgi:hypothetical protein
VVGNVPEPFGESSQVKSGRQCARAMRRFQGQLWTKWSDCARATSRIPSGTKWSDCARATSRILSGTKWSDCAGGIARILSGTKWSDCARAMLRILSGTNVVSDVPEQLRESSQVHSGRQCARAILRILSGTKVVGNVPEQCGRFQHQLWTKWSDCARATSIILSGTVQSGRQCSSAILRILSGT